MAAQRRKLNTAQRKALERFIRQSYEPKIEEKNEDDWAERQRQQAEIIAEIKQELEVDRIEAEIQELERKKSKLGFVGHHNGVPLAGSKAGKLYDERISKVRKKKKDLHEEMEAKIARIWTVETVEEAEEIAGIQ